MEELKPGTKVRVVIEGEFVRTLSGYGEWLEFSTGDAYVDVPSTDPAVTISIVGEEA